MIFILFLITVSQASAADSDDSDLTASDDLAIDSVDIIDSNTEELNEGNAISTEEELDDNEQSDVQKQKEMLSGSNSITVSDKTFSGIQAAIDNANENDTIILEGSYVNDLENKSIMVNKSISFIGKDNALLDYYNENNCSTSILNISSSNVSLESIIFRNAASKMDGGCICSAYGLNINNCLFENANVSSCSGGAIYVENGESTISNSNFTYLYGASNDYRYGIAIYSLEDLILTNCNFINCSGNGVDEIVRANKTLILNNCSFINSSSTKTKNMGQNYGGDSGVYGKDCIIDNCRFINLSSESFSSSISYGDSAHINNSYFENNSGGWATIRAWGKFSWYDKCNLTISNSQFKANGVLIHSRYPADYKVINSTFEDNGRFTFNGAYPTGQFSVSAFIDLCNSTFINNPIGIAGPSDIRNCVFNNTNAKALHIQKNSSSIYFGISITDCSFNNCSSDSNGSAIYFDEMNYNINLSSCRFTNCSAVDGGAIYFLANNGTITNCYFNNNTASNSAGAIYIGENTSNLRISFSNFTFNSALNDDVGNYRFGGAIYCLANKTVINNCTFYNNTAQDAGGAIFVSENTSSMAITGSLFYNNTVINNYNGINRGGGAISSLSKGLAIQKCIFSSNFALRSWGGAIRFIFNIDGGSLGSNGILSSGMLSDESIMTSVEDSIFQNNNAIEGKAVYTDEGAALIQNTFMINPTDDPDDMVYGLSQEELSRHNTFTESKFDSCINVTNLTFIFGQDIIVPVLSENLSGINLTIYDEYNRAVYNNVVVANGEFIVPDLSAGTYTIRYDSILDEDMFNPSSAESRLTINKAKSAVSSPAVTSYYGKTFSVNVNSANATSVKYAVRNAKGTVVKSGTLGSGQSLTGLSFAPGTYTLSLTAVVDSNHSASSSSSKITVSKATATISASALTTYYSSGKTWSITLKDTTNNKVLSGQKMTLKVYTGSKYKTYTATANSKGVATFKASSLAPGTHKVVISYSNGNYSTKSLTSSLKINKMALSYKVKRSTQKDGAGIHIWVRNKATGKLINKIKIKVRVYTGKKYKTITLVSGKYGSKGNAYVGYAVKGLVYSVGTHTVKIMAGDNYHSGTVKSSLVLKSTVRKYGKKSIIISKGKRTIK